MELNRVITTSVVGPLRRKLNRLDEAVSLRFPEIRGTLPVECLLRSLPEAGWRPEVGQALRTVRWIRPASVETYEFPENWPVFFRRDEAFGRRAVYELEGVHFSPQSGVCWRGKWAALESHGSLRKWFLTRPMTVTRGRVPKLPGRVTVLPPTGYAHFLLEEVPRLIHVLKEFPDTTVVVPSKRSSFYQGYLDLVLSGALGAPRVVERDEEILEGDSLVLTQAEEHSGFFFRDDLELVRRLRREALPIDQRGRSGGKLVYVSRRRGSRAFANETEIEQWVEANHGIVVALEELNLTAQMDLFAHASLVIAGHGAGLANIVWCEPGCRVVEIFSPSLFNDCFARTALSLRLQYAWVRASAGGGWGSAPIEEMQVLLEG